MFYETNFSVTEGKEVMEFPVQGYFSAENVWLGKDKKNQKYDWKQGHFFWTVIKQVDISLQKVLLRLAVKMKVTFALQNNICRALHKKTQKVYILLKGLNCYFFPRDPEFLFSVLENFRGKQWVLTNLNSFFLN